MEAARITLSMLFTAFGASIVIGALWFLFESFQEEDRTPQERHRRRLAQGLAAGIAAFTGGLLCTQFSSLITARYYPGATGWTPVMPLAIAAGALIMVGAAVKAWMLRPRRVANWRWLLGIALSSALLVLVRVTFL